MNAPIVPVSWSRRTNIYEVNLRQYTSEGTINSFRTHLPRLSDMGVKVLWFMPLTPISLKNRKGLLGSYYASSSYTTINPEFGEERDFKLLVAEAHHLGMKVIIDWVANHTGCDHEWTIEHPSFYKVNHQGDFFDAHGWDDVIDLDYDNQHMRTVMIDAMHEWVEKFDLDGFRCDMAMLTPVDFWMQARTSLEKKKKLFWIAELDPLDHPSYMTVFDSAYTWRWMNAANDFRSRGSRQIHQLKEVLGLYQQTNLAHSSLAWFTSNHDENSWNGTEYEKYGPAAKPWAVFAHTWKGMPLMYSGQELPNAKRLQFFDKDPIHWNSTPALHDFYKTLFQLRKDYSSIVYGDTFILPSSDHNVMAYIRHHQDQVVLVVLNVSKEHVTIQCNHDLLKGHFKQVFSGMQYPFDGYVSFELMPGDYFVYIKS